MILQCTGQSQKRTNDYQILQTDTLKVLIATFKDNKLFSLNEAKCNFKFMFV